MTAWLVLFTMINHPQVCQTVQNEWIVGADLARAIPAFSAIPRDASLEYAPSPGSSKVFLYPELKRIGARYGIQAPADSQACFEWKMAKLTEDAVRTAIRDSLEMPQARVEVLELSQSPAPAGKLEFPMSGLSVAGAVDPATPVLWRGHVSYAGHRTFAVWAKVRVAATMTRVVAIESLAALKPIEKNQVRLETYDGFPLHVDVAREIEQVIGRVPKRPIRANLPVMVTDLTEPLQIQRGERVGVTVISGAAQVEMEAVAEGSGRQGDMITLTNPRSGKSFRARIEGRDRALVIPDTGFLTAGAQ